MISGFKSPHFTVSTKACFPMQNFMPLRAKLHENRIILPETIPFFGIICIWSPPTPSFMQIGFEIMGFRVYIANFALTSVIGGQLPGSSSTPFLRRPIPRFLFKFLSKWWYFFKIKLLSPGWKTFQYFDLSFFRYFASIPQKMYHIKGQYDSPSYIDSRESSYISRVRFAASKPIKQQENLTQSAPGFRCNRPAVRLQ